MPPRAAFVTIGQSPRTDVLPDILAWTQTQFSVTELGALDGLDDAAIVALAPAPGEQRLVTRLLDGREVQLGKAAIDDRLHEIMGRLDEEGFDLLVLLCTGQFSPFTLRTPFIEPQHVVDHFTQGLAYGASQVGVMLPSPAQIDEFHGLPGVATRAVGASPFQSDFKEAMRQAGADLADADIIVMHCIAYTEAMQAIVRQASGRPVLLSRRLVADAIDMLLS